LPALAEDEGGPSSSTVIKTKNKLRFSLPKDWPVKEYGGFIAPIPIEEYMLMKFEKDRMRFEKFEKRLVLIEAALRREGFLDQEDESSEDSARPNVRRRLLSSP